MIKKCPESGKINWNPYQKKPVNADYSDTEALKFRKNVLTIIKNLLKNRDFNPIYTCFY